MWPEPGSALESYFTIEMPAPLQVMTALLLSFVVGLGLSMVPRGVLRKGFIEFRAIITRLIETIIHSAAAAAHLRHLPEPDLHGRGRLGYSYAAARRRRGPGPRGRHSADPVLLRGPRRAS